MTTTWILVANASQASVYSSPRVKLFNGHAQLELVDTIEHPTSREKNLAIASDKLGHHGHGTFVESSEPKEHEMAIFAKELANYLEEGRVRHQFDDLIIVASPKFQGMIHQQMNNQLNRCLSMNIGKDYTQQSERQLISHLQEHL
jgi:protein required for attachment to host cells